MHGDFSRDSFNPHKGFTRVLMQQGRLIVDADWNEQSAILLDYLRTLATDLIGWHGGTGVAPGNGKPYLKNAGDTGPFLVTLNANNEFEGVAGGRYYIDGLLINEIVPQIEKDNEPDPVLLPNCLVFLDVWEHHVVAASDHSLLDDALGGIDTTSRTRLMAHIRVVYTNLDKDVDGLKKDEDFRRIVIKKSNDAPIVDRRKLDESKLPHLTAWTNLDSGDEEGCDDEGGSGYTGLENQLYRVEVHHAGKDGKTFWDGSDSDEKKAEAFTLKWSRDNGSVVYHAKFGSGSVTLQTKWRDETRKIRTGDWVELIKDLNDNGPIVSVKDVRDDNGSITVLFSESPADPELKASDSILLRRWDHRPRKNFPMPKSDGGFLVKQEKEKETLAELKKTKQIADEDQGTSVSIPLEDNLFVRLTLPEGSELQAGDYWLIPARAATGDIIWPKNHFDANGKHTYSPVPADYTKHHYAPIALIDKTGKIIDLRRNIDPIAE